MSVYDLSHFLPLPLAFVSRNRLKWMHPQRKQTGGPQCQETSGNKQVMDPSWFLYKMNLLFFGKADCKSTNIRTDASALHLSLRISKEYWNTELVHLETRSAERINADRSLNRNFVIRFAWNNSILSILIPYLVKSREKNPTTASPNTATKLNLVHTMYFFNHRKHYEGYFRTKLIVGHQFKSQQLE